MAIERVIEQMNGILDDISRDMNSGKMPKILGHSIVAQIDMGGGIGAESFKKGADFAFSALVHPSSQSQWDKMNNTKVWLAVLRKVLKGLPTTLGGKRLQPMPANGVVPGPGVYILTKRDVQNPFLSLLICYTQNKKGAARATTDAVAKDFRDLVWKEWVNTSGIKEAIGDGGLLGPVTTRVSSRSTNRTLDTAQADWVSGGSMGGAELAHTSQTTVGVLTLREIEEFQASVNLGYGINTYDLTESVRNSLNIDYEEINNKENVGQFTFDTFVHMRFDKNFAGSEYTDLTFVRPEYENEIRKRMQKHSFFTSAARDASKSPKDRIIEDVIVDITKPFKKNNKGTVTTKKKITAKPFKNDSRRKNIKTAKQTSVAQKVKGTLAISGKGKRLRPEKTKNEKTKSILSVTRLINKRLPAEVRRNMGRPALINQTGRFSNSVKLDSLRETPKGLSGKYSYLLRPYETFENTGERRWSAGYNPKPLIAKSIRNLAMQYTEQKLVQLRRT